jgi:hypothetical protein
MLKIYHKVSLRTLTSGGGPLRGRAQRASQASALQASALCAFVWVDSEMWGDGLYACMPRHSRNLVC